VQHKILENKKKIFELIQKGCTIYVCGDGKKMELEVRNSLIEVIRKEGNMLQWKAQQYFETLINKQKYKRDVWFSS
jgi:sulfite reductase alpha subunit-like flavoprotein